MGSASVTAISETEEQGISVVICTRNRGDSIVPTIQSVLAQTYSRWELLILDQSDENSTENAVTPLLADSRIRYFRLTVPGKPLALNRALELVKNNLVAITDDDCEALPEWLSALESAFALSPRIGCIFGNVEAGPCDPGKYYIPTNILSEDYTITHLRDFLLMPGMKHFGIGASHAVRGDVMRQIGGFDPCIGPGAKFGYADDHDLAARLLLSGWHVHLSSAAKVIHYGFREWRVFSNDFKRDGMGFGATFAKHLKCGRIYYGSLRMLSFFSRQAASNLITNKRPLGLAFPQGWLRGLVRGLRHPIDRQSRTFRPDARQDLREFTKEVSEIVPRSQQT